MADNVNITPGSGAIVATDDVGGGVQIQRVKLDMGVEGVSNPANSGNPYIVGIDADSVALLRRAVKLLETLAVVDSGQRQRVTIDAGTLPTVTTVGTVSTITGGTITTVGTVTTVTNAVPVGNVATIANVDPRYGMTDVARYAYAQGIRSSLLFS